MKLADERPRGWYRVSMQWNTMKLEWRGKKEGWWSMLDPEEWSVDPESPHFQVVEATTAPTHEYDGWASR